MRRIPGKGKIVNRGEVESPFAAKNLTAVGRIGLFLRFRGKLGVEEEDPAQGRD